MTNLSIRSNIENLSSRGNKIRTMLAAISPNNGPQWKPYASMTSYKIVTYDVRTGGSPTDHYFATLYGGLKAQYYEFWEKSEENSVDFWYLERAYFHLLKLDDQTDQLVEYLLLHCDPSHSMEADPESTEEEKKKAGRKASYKRSLHLHIKEAPAPFPHAHIALHTGFDNIVLESVDSLSDAIEKVILMIKDEILEKT